MDTDTYIQNLVVTNPLTEPVVQAAIRALQLPPGFILNHPNYYAFFTCSMFYGMVSG